VMLVLGGKDGDRRSYSGPCPHQGSSGGTPSQKRSSGASAELKGGGIERRAFTLEYNRWDLERRLAHDNTLGGGRREASG